MATAEHLRLWLAVVLLLCSGPVHADTDAVEVLHRAPGFERARTDDDLKQLYSDNLERDFQQYASRTITIDDLHVLLKALAKGPKPTKTLSLVVIKDNVVHTVPFHEPQIKLAIKRMASIKEGLTNATKRGLQFPNTMFVMNTWDEARCSTRSSRCKVPVFSLIKQWDWKANVGRQPDVLLPFFNHYYGDIINYPWERKTNKALMRAAMQNGMSRNCTRMWLIHLSKTTRDGQRMLDVGITNNLKKGFTTELTNYVEVPDHAKWKYLISADGFTASCRFGKLLQTNSVVLKEETPWIEYYYRSVKGGQHYLNFTKDTALQLVQSLETIPEEQLKSISLRAQKFAYRHLSQYAKALYVRRAVQMYNALFRNGGGDMAQFMSKVNTSRLSFVYVMDLMQQYVSANGKI